MKALDELKESIASLDKALEKRIPRPAVEMVLVSDCLTGIVKVLEELVSQTGSPAGEIQRTKGPAREQA